MVTSDHNKEGAISDKVIDDYPQSDRCQSSPAVESPAWEEEGVMTILWPGDRVSDLVLGLVLSRHSTTLKLPLHLSDSKGPNSEGLVVRKGKRHREERRR